MTELVSQNTGLVFTIPVSRRALHNVEHTSTLHIATDIIVSDNTTYTHARNIINSTSQFANCSYMSNDYNRIAIKDHYSQYNFIDTTVHMLHRITSLQ